MTQDELEGYITHNLAWIRKKYIFYDNDKEYLQQTLLDLNRKAEQLIVNNNEEFVDLLLSYYIQLRARRNDQVYKRAENQELLLVNHSYVAQDEYPYARTESPFDNIKVEALEYIDMIGHKRIRTVMYQYFILGMTYTEIGTEHTIGKSMVEKIVNQGIAIIKESIERLDKQ